jgi:hypothetical protein
MLLTLREREVLIETHRLNIKQRKLSRGQADLIRFAFEQSALG